MKKFISLISIILILALGLSVTVSAEPTDSFTHEDTASGQVVSVMSREMYTAIKTITASDLGLEKSFDGLNDICTDSQGKLYLLVSGRSWIVVLNSDYTLDKVLTIVDAEGSNVKFDGAEGIFVDETNIYVCDTRNSQILVTNFDGLVVDVWGEPESNLIPDDFFYQPYRVVKDSKGYTYILSLGCYYGALTYSPENKFLGFYGANNVEATALDTLSYLWDMLTQTDEKKALSVKKLPYSFVDLCLDSDDYMITCTGLTESDENGTGQIRKLSPGGADILYKRYTNGTSANSSAVNFVEEKVIEKFGVKKPQNIVAVDVDKDGMIYALDQTHGLIYIYDSECNMLGGFGGGYDYATRLGIFDKANCMALNGEDVIVGDSDSSIITVFERTEYGSLLMHAQQTYIRGEYVEAMPIWEDVLSLNNNCQLAYRGMAVAHLSQKNYDEALKYAEAGLDYTSYNLAWQKILDRYITENFVWIFTLVLLILAALITFIVVVKRKKIVLIKNRKIKTAIESTYHPFQSFDAVKYKNQGSIIIACVLLLLFYIANVLKETASGFLYTKTEPNTYNTLYTLLTTAGLVLLWSVANWLIASLFAGKGTFKDVFIATTYSVIPLTVFTFVSVILSHFLPLSGLEVMDGIKVAVLIFTFFILSIAIMTVHEYDFFKFLGTSLVTVFFMLLIVFVVFLVGVLLQQVGELFSSIYREIFFR